MGEEISLGELIGAATGPGEWMVGSLGQFLAKAGQQRRDLRAGE
ncbi:hypothetical protein [Nocardia asiatica]|nr:hypothetical protein [Nocardia asiatica]